MVANTNGWFSTTYKKENVEKNEEKNQNFERKRKILWERKTEEMQTSARQEMSNTENENAII